MTTSNTGGGTNIMEILQALQQQQNGQQAQNQKSNLQNQVYSSMMNSPSPQGQMVGGGAGGPQGPGTYVPPSGMTQAASALSKVVGGAMLGRARNNQTLQADQNSIDNYASGGGMQSDMNSALATLPQNNSDAQLSSIADQAPSDMAAEDATGPAASAALNALPVQSIDPTTSGMGGLSDLDDDDADDIADMF